jgi:RHS repeat-associated protein
MKQTRIDHLVEQTVDYIGNFVYEYNVLKYILTGEGRVVVNPNGTYEYQYSLKDHLGNTRVTFNQNGQIIQEDAYYPFVMKMNGLCYQSGVDYENKYLYNGKELQDDFGLDWYDYGARFYDPQLGRWHSVDPLAEAFNFRTPYSYAANNPIIFIDQEGREPVKRYAGNVSTFIILLNTSPSKVGLQKGLAAENMLISMSATEWNWNQMKPLPITTPYFNNKQGRYIYTETVGWIDMSHFMFYAGKAYANMRNGSINPIGDAMQDGYLQEALDRKNSAYSYEDLVSDKLGTYFAVCIFNPDSDLTFGEQLYNYLFYLVKAKNPEDAPNWKEMPDDLHEGKPTHTNRTTNPMFIKWESNASDNRSPSQKSYDEMWEYLKNW